MLMAEIIKALPAGVLVGIVGIVAALVLLVPISLRLAGLTGQQIADTISLTLQFFVNIVREFRAQNKSAS